MTSSPASPTALSALDWRVRVVMAERGLHRIADLHRSLAPFGLKLSAEQLGKVVARMPQRLNMQLLAALCAVLQCRVEDLLRTDGLVPEAIDRDQAVRDSRVPAPPTRPPRARSAQDNPKGKPAAPKDAMTVAQRRTLLGPPTRALSIDPAILQ